MKDKVDTKDDPLCDILLDSIQTYAIFIKDEHITYTRVLSSMKLIVQKTTLLKFVKIEFSNASTSKIIRQSPVYQLPEGLITKFIVCILRPSPPTRSYHPANSRYRANSLGAFRQRAKPRIALDAIKVPYNTRASKRALYIPVAIVRAYIYIRSDRSRYAWRCARKRSAIACWRPNE